MAGIANIRWPMTAINKLLEANKAHFLDKGQHLYEPQFRGTKMNDQERRQFVAKAKLDRVAYEAAQLLSLGETSKAAILIGEANASAGKDQLKMWLRHYATMRFKMAGNTVDSFLGTLRPVNASL